MATREAIASGSFYNATKTILKKDLEEFFQAAKNYKGDFAEAVIAPHAGYVYSGRIAAISINSLKRYENYVILGPNHTGFGKLIAITEADHWETPLGKIEVNKEICKTIANITSAEFDESAHIGEHSIEVLLPFIQHKFKGVKIIPVVVAEHRKKELIKFGKALAELSKEYDFGLIVSSDFTHYEREEVAKQKDFEAIKIICNYNIDKLERNAIEKNYSICGIAPIMVAMQFARDKGLKAELLAYTTSAEFSQDRRNVVGYASIAFYKNSKGKY